MLRTRLISAAIFIPFAVLVILIGGPLFGVVAGVALVVCGAEYAAALRHGGFQPYTLILLVAIGLIAVVQYLGVAERLLGAGLSALLIACLIAMIKAYSGGATQPVADFGLTLGGALYIGWTGAHLIALRQLPDGMYWTVLAVVATGMGDVGAFFVGRTIGRRKMAPIVSPGKTWEGFAGGVLFATVWGLLLAALAIRQDATLQLWQGALVGLVVGLVGPIGDLGMSAIKRATQIKNFSNLIPGHGGVLDRFDSILLASAVSYYLIRLLEG